MASKNLCGKTRKVEDPYEIWIAVGGWEWRVLKKYQSPEKEAENPYARWFCAVKSPYTYGSFDMGDVYVSDIKASAMKIT
jgi:hypothetical protein